MIRVYAFDCRPPTSGGDVLQAHLRLGHEFYNELVAVERARREQYNAMCDKRSPALADVAAQIEACRGLLADARHQAGRERVAARSRRGASDD